MKIIFLDIDGVMNSTLSKGPYISDMEIEKLELLSSLIKFLLILLNTNLENGTKRLKLLLENGTF